MAFACEMLIDAENSNAQLLSLRFGSAETPFRKGASFTAHWSPQKKRSSVSTCGRNNFPSALHRQMWAMASSSALEVTGPS